jgi:hypothetical protein
MWNTALASRAARPSSSSSRISAITVAICPMPLLSQARFFSTPGRDSAS